MIDLEPYALGTSLLAARMGKGAMMPPGEQVMLGRLQAAARNIGCDSPQHITAIYIALKLHVGVLIYGSARDRIGRLLDTFVNTIVGLESEQVVHLRGPIGNNDMAQRLAALRLGEFISMSLEESAREKAWFLIVDTPGAPDAMLRWVEKEWKATLQANGQSARQFPPNMFVMGAAGEPPEEPGEDWLAIAEPAWSHNTTSPHVALPPVGYQRQLLNSQLTARSYRRRLLSTQHRHLDANVRGDRWIRRWLAASVDDQGRGLWVQHDLAENACEAVGVLEAFHPGLQGSTRQVLHQPHLKF